VALLVEMIADRRMDRGEFLRTSHSAEARHGTFSSSKRLVRILRPMVQAATGFLLLTRPGFTGDCFVQMSGDFIKGIQVCIEILLRFLWRDISDCAVQALSVVPVHPFQGFPFDPADGFPRAEEVDDFGFE